MQFKIRPNPTLAYVAPLAVFLCCFALTPLFTVKNPELPWWQSAPEHWIFPLQTMVCGLLLVFFWSSYTFRPLRGFGLATALGVAGIGLWILPGWWYVGHGEGGAGVPWLGYAARHEGFDASLFNDVPVAYAADVFMRFVRLAVVVPFVEEIFWRGFLMRFVIAGDGSFLNVPFGRHHWVSYGMSTAGFVLEHQTEDWLGALIFGSLMYWLCIRTKSLGACVWMHAVANLLLGFYVMRTGQWGFW